MRRIGTAGEFILIEEDGWQGTMDAAGKICISPEMHYCAIHAFSNGVAVAYKDRKWGLIDEKGNPISKFIYDFVEPWGEGYYRCELKSKRNLLRADGTEVLSQGFRHLGHPHNGVFVVVQTISKTKTTPTRFLHGLCHVNGDILFMPIFDKIDWHDEIKHDYYIAWLGEKIYALTPDGAAYDFQKEHEPTKDGEKENFHWTSPMGTVCEGCIFSDGIKGNGECCGCLKKEDFRNAVTAGRCEHRKKSEEQQSYFEWKVERKRKEEEIHQAKVSDAHAVKLLTEFVRDRLHGNIDLLKEFDFSTLRDDPLYGKCGGFAFSVPRTETMRAIMCLAFKDAWPEMNYETIEKYLYSIDKVNTTTMLFGVPLGSTFKGIEKFRPSASMLDRVWAFHKTCDKVGNYWVWPCKGNNLYVLRESLNRKQRYIDTFLRVIYNALVNGKGTKDVLAWSSKNKAAFKPYMSQEGFAHLSDELLLEHYMSESGTPLNLFAGVWSDQLDLTQDVYFEAVESYMKFCSQVIDYRTDMIISRLKVALGLEKPQKAESNVLFVEMPSSFRKLESLPDDPEGSSVYGCDTEFATCFVMVSPIKQEELLPTDRHQLIMGVDQYLSPKQGLVEADTGMTRYEKEFSYTIVKQQQDPSGIMYLFTCHLTKDGQSICVKGQFDERGTTGFRDMLILEHVRREQQVKSETFDGWFYHPYAETYHYEPKGMKMNLSEQRKYDLSFPEHPISILHKLIDYLMDKN